MLVINLFAGPGAGKSQTAFGLSFYCKLNGLNMEFVSEQAKSFTWEKRTLTLECQPYVFAKQMRDLWRLKDQVDLVVTDSPILLTKAYTGPNWPPSFLPYVSDQFNQFNNLNYFIRRTKPYNPIGRNQTEQEARIIDEYVEKLLIRESVGYRELPGDHLAPSIILADIGANLGKKLIIPDLTF